MVHLNGEETTFFLQPATRIIAFSNSLVTHPHVNQGMKSLRWSSWVFVEWRDLRGFLCVMKDFRLRRLSSMTLPDGWAAPVDSLRVLLMLFSLDLMHSTAKTPKYQNLCLTPLQHLQPQPLVSIETARVKLVYPHAASVFNVFVKPTTVQQVLFFEMHLPSQALVKYCSVFPKS